MEVLTDPEAMEDTGAENEFVEHVAFKISLINTANHIPGRLGYQGVFKIEK